GRPLPALSWEHDARRDGHLRLRVEAEPAPRSARLRVARSSTRDFREAAWTSEPMHHDGSAWVGSVPRPNGVAVALFGDLTFDIEGLTYHLSTQIRQAGLGLDPGARLNARGPVGVPPGRRASPPTPTAFAARP
ncbi:MAG TPA: hypothetical protein VKP69_31660, partial [Isosphaeraceae bacterium]|nr:hypothetical protein [Isosphaeraceae bacterium]